ncbi:uroporphyrinogen decarboxylase family protein, partial [Planctomycetota bacterium]
EKSLEKLVFVELTDQHWDEVNRLNDTKGDYALFAQISLGIGHIWQTMDMMAFSVAMIENQELLHEILRRYTEWTTAVIEKINTIGIDCVWTFDDFAFKTGTVYSPDFFKEVVLPYARTIAEAIRIPWVFHSDGNYMGVLDDLAGLGMNAINPVEPGCLDIPEIRRRYPDLVLIGNVEVDILGRGTEEETRADVDRAFRELGGTGPFMPSSSNSIPEFCKPENVRAMFARYRELVDG